MSVRPPGEGVLCAAAIFGLMAEVGRRCFPDKDRAFQTELARSVEKLDEFMLRDPDWTAAKLATFKASPTRPSVDTTRLCQGDAIQMFDAIAAQGASALRVSIDKSVSRPGKPSWGDCL